MPAAKNTYVSPLLTSFSLGYNPGTFIADQILPTVRVKKDSGKIATYDMSNMRIVDSIRAQGSQSNVVNHKVTISDHYFLEDHVLREYVTNEEMENAEDPIMPKKDAVKNLLDRIGLIREKMLADIMSNTANFTNSVTLSGTDQWSDTGNSDPVGDINTGIATVRAAVGLNPNALVFGNKTYRTLKLHPDIKDAAKGAIVITDLVLGDVIKNLFSGIQKIIVADAMYNSANEGQTDTLAEVWGNHAWVMYIPSSPTLKSQAFGFTYRKDGGITVMDIPQSTDSDLMDRESDLVRVKDKYDQKIVNEKCGYFIKNAVV